MIRALAITGLALLSPGRAQAPAFAPGQVWVHHDAASKRDTSFLIRARLDVPDFAVLVAMQVDGMEAEGLDAQARRMGGFQLVQVYPEAQLRRFAGKLSQTIPGGLAAGFDLKKWYVDRSTGWLPIQTMSPGALISEFDAARRAFAELEDKLPAYLPKAEPDKPAPSDVRTRLRLELDPDGPPRRVLLRLDGKAIADHAALTAALRQQTGDSGKPLTLLIEPGARVTYGDVAGIVDTASKVTGVEIRFAKTGGSKTPEPHAVKGSRQTPRPPAPPALAPGQIWSFRGGGARRLTIQRCLQVPGLGQVCVVRIDGLRSKSGETSAKDLVWWSTNLRTQLEKLEDTSAIERDGSGPDHLLAALRDGRVGVMRIAPAEFCRWRDAR